MRSMWHWAGLALLASMVAPSSATEAPIIPTPAKLQGAMAGQWTGALGYRDYQTNELFELPVKTEIVAVPDGVTIVRTSSYDDGPQTGLVYITSTSFYEPAGTVKTTIARKGKPFELLTDQVRVVAYTDPAHWTVVYERTGTDGDSPARVRTTEVRDGDTVLAKKDVLPLAAAKKRWQFRNQLRLVRVAG